ncbi:hypothetical protein ACFW9O_19140 [Streptomyces sp. NPDC059499]|uniref:hypothetical protein n=1 Tax=Streptomyces sp. NPDC059499 TaxID=3346852 RepID=UPI00369736BA
MFTAFFAAAAVVGFVGLRLAGPARNRDLYVLPVLGTCAFILTLAAIAAAIPH